ncbi:MAG: aminotransferase class IV [Candidatus Brocadiae bacterium]|nr:aminotransferase class IV [Candidatus Brocadiia bacterium]
MSASRPAARAPRDIVWTSRGWVNGSTPLIGAADLALQHGFGLFETLRAYGGRVFRPDEHFRRLERTARTFRIRLPLDAQTFREACAELLEAARRPDARVRLTVAAGPPPLAVLQALPLAAPERGQYARGVTLWPAPFCRNTRGVLSGHKTINYLDNYWARAEANRRGHFEALMLNERDEVAEGTRANVFWVKDGELVTPSLDTGILEGVTRTVLIGIAREGGRRVREARTGVAELLAADEAFLASTIVEVLPVVAIGRRRIGAGRPGPVAKRLRAAFARRVAAELAAR